jgi:FAD/FMN-containing dehydrogenase
MSGSRQIPGFEGQLIAPGDSDYETARSTDNAAVDARPALIARAASATDVAAVVRWLPASDLQLAIRSGGHSFAGHSTGDGVVVLDVRALDGIEFDPQPAAAWAWAGSGVTAGEFTNLAYERRRAVSFGDTGTVGLGGLVVGGGIGWLVRRYGLTIDSLLAAELVTADGELVTASAEEHPDLFWALRGGGGNFGVVTRYKLALRPIDRVLHGMLLMAATPTNVRQVLEMGLAAPDELTLMPFVMAIPPMDELAADHHGQLGLWVYALWSGERAAGRQVIDELRALAPVLIDTIAGKPYPAVYPTPAQDGQAERGGWTSSSVFLDRVDDGLGEAVMGMVAGAPEGECLVMFRPLGGAAGRVPQDGTAFAWRDKPVLAWIIAGQSNGAQSMPTYRTWANDVRRSLEGFGAGAFVNFMAEDSATVLEAAYPPETLARLREVKRRYDPHNVFRHNHNIPPAEGS